MNDRKSSQSIRITAALLVAGILAVSLINPVQCVTAAQVRRAVFAPIHIRPGETLLLSAVNIDKQPITVRFLTLNATDLSSLKIGAARRAVAQAAGSAGRMYPGFRAQRAALQPQLCAGVRDALAIVFVFEFGLIGGAEPSG